MKEKKGNLKIGLKKPYLFFIIIFLIIIISVTTYFFNLRPERLKITAIFTSNLNGSLDPCGCMLEPLGGLAYLGTTVKSIKKEAENFLFFDTGDLLFDFHDISLNYPPKTIDKFKKNANLIVDIMNHLDLTAVTFGDRDLGGGYDTWEKLQKKAAYPVISINSKDRSNLIKPYLIKKIRGIKILITGIQDPVTVKPFFSTERIEIEDYEVKLKALIEEKKPDLTILLSHSGILMDDFIPGEFSNIDLVLGAHSMNYKGFEKKENTYIIHNGGDGQIISKIDIVLTLNKTTNKYEKDIEITQIPIDPKLEPDEKIIKILSNKENVYN